MGRYFGQWLFRRRSAKNRFGHAYSCEFFVLVLVGAGTLSLVGLGVAARSLPLSSGSSVKGGFQSVSSGMKESSVISGLIPHGCGSNDISSGISWRKETELLIGWKDSRDTEACDPAVRLPDEVSSESTAALSSHDGEVFSGSSLERVPSVPKATALPTRRGIVAQKRKDIPPLRIYKTVDGKRVCAKKDDHPSGSERYKKLHYDQECCLDPDEIPHPECYYPPEKYGKLLEKAKKRGL